MCIRDRLGAIRLPNNPFKGNAGPEVVSDILILQKRDRLIDLSLIHICTQIEGQTGSIGYLRGDFGAGGKEFFSSWFDHRRD